MTLKQLPNLALFTFVHPPQGFSLDRVWQKQFYTRKHNGKKVTVEYIAQAMKAGRGWRRDAGGGSGLFNRHTVLLVATRKAKLRL